MLYSHSIYVTHYMSLWYCYIRINVGIWSPCNGAIVCISLKHHFHVMQAQTNYSNPLKTNKLIADSLIDNTLKCFCCLNRSRMTDNRRSCYASEWYCNRNLKEIILKIIRVYSLPMRIPRNDTVDGIRAVSDKVNVAMSIFTWNYATKSV